MVDSQGIKLVNIRSFFEINISEDFGYSKKLGRVEKCFLSKKTKVELYYGK